MKTNLELQKDVQEELKWEPMLRDAEIGASAKDGIVTLTGIVDSYAKKLAAEKAAKTVMGVKAVAQEIEVKLLPVGKRSDTDIAQAALNALKWHTSVPDEKIKLKVEDGWAKVEGEVDWQFQKDAITKALENLIGVKGVTNFVTIKPRIDAKVVKDNISNAFYRNAAIDSANIKVETTGNKVILKGTVHSWFERKAAEKAAWSAPGVINVEDDLLVTY